MESAQLRQLRERENALKAQLLAVEAALEQAMNESAWPEDSGERHLHHRPSWSLLGGTEGTTEAPKPMGAEEANMEVEPDGCRWYLFVCILKKNHRFWG